MSCVTQRAVLLFHEHIVTDSIVVTGPCTLLVSSVCGSCSRAVVRKTLLGRRTTTESVSLLKQCSHNLLHITTIKLPVRRHRFRKA